MNALVLILLALAALLAVLMARAVAFRPKTRAEAAPTPVAIDEAAVAAHMQALVRVRTVSHPDKALEDPAPFEALPALLASLYPRVHAALACERIGDRGLLYRWKGKRADAPGVLMSHYDVVPAEEALWQKQPFDGIIEDGVLWGRGTLDTKGTLLAIFEAAELLLSEGFTPENDLYFSFAGDEEIAGGGAPGIVAALTARGIQPAFVLDEGGAVVEKVFPGVAKPCALVGTGEKGNMDVLLTAASKGGHASSPPPHTPVGVLARAVTRVEGKPFPFTLTPPAAEMFDTLGRQSSLAYRMIFANLWCFAPLLNLLCKKTGGEMNALVRTTCAFTQMAGSAASNVLPPVATVGANLRIVGGETTESARARLESVIRDPDVRVEIVHGMDPSPISRTDGEPWQRLGGAIAETWPDAILSPYLMVAASDARHYARVSDSVYRFSAMALSAEERKLIHGNDERVPVEKLCTAVKFYARLMRRC